VWNSRCVRASQHGISPAPLLYARLGFAADFVFLLVVLVLLLLLLLLLLLMRMLLMLLMLLVLRMLKDLST
jgi:hypothetical protein